MSKLPRLASGAAGFKPRSIWLRGQGFIPAGSPDVSPSRVRLREHLWN